MASEAPTPNAAPAATQQGWRRLDRNLPTLKKKEDSLFLDARLPAHEQAKNIVFKYSSDGDVLYHTDCSSLEMLKEQTCAPAALDYGSSSSNSDCCTTKRNTSESPRRKIEESRSITFGSRSDAHMGSSSTVASGGELENIHRSQDIQEHEESETVQSKTTQEGDLTRSKSSITQCVERNFVHSSNEESPLEIKKFSVDAEHSPSNTEETCNVGVAGVSNDTTSNKSGGEAEDTHSSQSGPARTDWRNIRDTMLSASSDTSVEEEKLVEVDTDATQRSGSASPADGTVASRTTVAEGGQKAYAEILKTTVKNLLSFRKSSQEQEHVHRAEHREAKADARPQEKGGSDDDIETALFKDDATWERLIADLAQFRVK